MGKIKIKMLLKKSMNQNLKKMSLVNANSVNHNHLVIINFAK